MMSGRMTALVTGASGAIGYAIARELAAMGHKVALGYAKKGGSDASIPCAAICGGICGNGKRGKQPDTKRSKGEQCLNSSDCFHGIHFLSFR